MNKDCEWCHNPIPESESGKVKKYCSEKCKTSRNNLRQKARQVHRRENQICKHCGKKFAFIKIKLYCSTECQIAVSRKNVIERKKKKRAELKCQQCERPLINAKKMTARFCPECLNDRKARARRRTRKLQQMEWAKKGLCKSCGKPAVPGRVSCQEHLDKFKKFAAKYADKRKEREVQKKLESLPLYEFPLGKFHFDEETFDKFFTEIQESSWNFPHTDHQPGSEGKIAVIQDRLAKGLPLFHPKDPTYRSYAEAFFNIAADF